MLFTNEQQKAAFLLLELGEYGNAVETFGQWFASALECGMTRDEAVELWAETLVRGMNLHYDTPGNIWPTLTPGGTQGGRFLEFEVVDKSETDHGVTGVGEASARTAEAIADIFKGNEGHSVKVYPNIRLEYNCSIYIEDDVYFANSSEFFMDEHGIQWVKFVPNNGGSKGQETIVRTDAKGFRFAHDYSGRTV